jgi:drug/metabolite transporter (DMT)-like permease
MHSSPARARLLLVATAVLFSTGGVAIKAANLNGWQVASFRSLVAALALVIFIPEARRGWNWRVAPVSICYAATLVCFVLATRLTTAANAIFLQSTAPAYLLLLGPFLLREPVRRSDIGYIVAVFAGLSLFALGAQRAGSTAPDPRAGNIFALASGLAWAFALAGLRWLSRGNHPSSGLAAVVAGNIVAFIAALSMALPLPPLEMRNAAIILYLGVFQIGLSYVLLTRAVRSVTAFEATTILLLEPALNPVWVWMIHGESPGAWPLAGGVVILMATVIHAWRLRNAAA